MPANVNRQAWVGVLGRLRVIHDDVAVLAGVLGPVQLVLQGRPPAGERLVGGPVRPCSQPLPPGRRGGSDPDPGRVGAGQRGPDAAAAFEHHDAGGLGGVPFGVAHGVPVEPAPAGRLLLGQRLDDPLGQHVRRLRQTIPARVQVVHVDDRRAQRRGELAGQPGLARPGAAVHRDQPGPAQPWVGPPEPSGQLYRGHDRRGRHPWSSLARLLWPAGPAYASKAGPY
jgi:hypothetical protein